MPHEEKIEYPEDDDLETFSENLDLEDEERLEPEEDADETEEDEFDDAE